MSKRNQQDIPWNEVDQAISDLDTGQAHELNVVREALPIIFIPGIMGSVLRVSGTNGEGDGNDGLPNLRWNPASKKFMWWNYSGISAQARVNMLIGGEEYDNAYLEVHNSNPVGNGFQGVSESSYHGFLQFLQRSETFGPLTKIFDLPIFAFGYNWTDSNTNGGKNLAIRIDEVIAEARATTGKCEKVILVTHSMGGLVARSASELAGAQGKILGIVHGVQPASGAPAAYWRMKAGFEGTSFMAKILSRVLGNSGEKVTPILGNMPGGLELLPTNRYVDGNGSSKWLTIQDNGQNFVSLPNADPYSEIYRVMGTGDEVEHPDRKCWGLVDPNLLNPSREPIDAPIDYGDPDSICDHTVPTAWEFYLDVLEQAETFHTNLGNKVHPKTYTYHGSGHTTSDRILMIGTPEVKNARRGGSNANSYPLRGFSGGFYREGKRRAILQAATGVGDGTVSLSSATAIDDQASQPPAPLAVETEHEASYKADASQAFSVRAITALCLSYYEEIRGVKVGE